MTGARRSRPGTDSRDDEPDDADTRGTDDTDVRALVVLPARNLRLPEVLRHIRAGRVVLVVPTPRTPD